MHNSIGIILYSRLHTGAVGENAAEFTSTCVHVADTFPISSKPMLQVYVAESPTEVPVNVLIPFTRSAGSGHNAVEQEV